MSIITYLNTLNTNIYPKLKLCKPNRIVVSPLKDIYNLELNIRLGNLNSLSFTIPTKIERNHELVDNPLVELIRDRYQIRMNFNNQTEYFVVLRKEKSMSNDGNSIVYHAYSLGKELDDKDAPRGYSEDGKNLSFHANRLLSETNWRIGFVDSKFNLTYRTVEVSTETVLSSIIQLAEKFNALILWDTVNRIINFHQPNNIGLNRGVRLKEGLLLESLSVAVDAEQVKTRLKAYGQDGLEFRNLSPTGSNYIEDFSYFMYPFEADVNHNVIKSSNYMTDALCIAILKYRKLLEDSQGQFANLRQQKTNKQAELVNLNQELRAFENELKLLKDERDVINYTYADNAPIRADWLDVISRINAKNTQITNKNNQITTNNNQLTTIQNNLTNLENLVKVENNYTADEILELNNFIFVGEYTNDSIIDEQDLLDEAIEVFGTINEPPLEVTVSLEGYLTEINDTVNLNLVSIGDTIRVNNDELQVNLRLKIIEIKIAFDNDKIDLTIANGKDIIDDDSKLIDMIYSASSTSNAVDIDKYKWNKGEQALDGLSQYINSNLDTAKQVLIGGYLNSTTINERGLYSKDLDDPNAFLVINNGVFAISADGGNSVAVAITKNGIFADNLYSRIILSNKLYIEDTDGVVTIQNALMTVFDLNNNPRVYLGRYPRFNNPSQFDYGLRVINGAFDIRTSNDTDKGIVINGDSISAYNNNGVRTFNVDAVTGLVSIIGGLDIRSSTSSNAGIVINSNGIRGYKSNGQLGFEITNSGDVTFGGKLDYADGVFTGLVDGTLSPDTINAIEINADQITAGKITSGQIEAGSITADAISVTNLSAISSDLGNITGGSISITTDMRIGKNLYLQGSGSNTIHFADLTYISSNGNGSIDIQCFNDLIIQAATTRFFGNVDFSNATVSGI